MIKTRLQTGFTLIEMLVVVSLLGIIFVVATDVFFTIIRSSNKSQAMVEIKQNGAYAQDAFAKNLRNAGVDGLTCAGAGLNQELSVKNQDQVSYKFLFEIDSANNDIVRLGVQKDGGATEYLISKHVAVDVTKPYGFECAGVLPDHDTSPDIIGLKFNLISTQNLRDEETVNIGFQTSVTTRNF